MRILGILLLIVSLCACSARRPTQIKCEPVTEFRCTVQCEQAETTRVFDLTSCADGSFSAFVVQPENLTGVCFSYDENGYTLDANGITDTFNKESFSNNSPVRMLFEALQIFLFTGTETLTDKGDNTYSASNMIGDQLVYGGFAKDGHILTITYPDRETVFTFFYENEE